MPDKAHQGVWFEIATGDVTFIEKLPTAIYTGSNVHDSGGNLYFSRFGDEESWSGNVRLAILNPSPRD